MIVKTIDDIKKKNQNQQHRCLTIIMLINGTIKINIWHKHNERLIYKVMNILIVILLITIRMIAMEDYIFVRKYEWVNKFGYWMKETSVLIDRNNTNVISNWHKNGHWI